MVSSFPQPWMSKPPRKTRWTATMAMAMRRCGRLLAFCSRSEPWGMSGFGLFIMLVGGAGRVGSIALRRWFILLSRRRFPSKKTPTQIIFPKISVRHVRRAGTHVHQCWGCRERRHDGRIDLAAPLPGETPLPGADSSETYQNWSRLVKATRHRQEQHPPQISELLLTMNPPLCKE